MEVAPLGSALKKDFSLAGLFRNESRYVEVLRSAAVTTRGDANAATRDEESFAGAVAVAAVVSSAGSRVSAASAPSPAGSRDLGR